MTDLDPFEDMGRFMTKLVKLVCCTALTIVVIIAFACWLIFA